LPETASTSPILTGEFAKDGYNSEVIYRILVSACTCTIVATLMSSCATTDTGSTSESGGSSVPGEKVTSDNQVMPNATTGVPSASVAW
jgi:hypothetical protein